MSLRKNKPSVPSVLVTGAAGFIGSHLTRELVKLRKYHVVALDDLSGGFRDNLPDNITFVRGSITNATLMKTIFKKYSFRHVYHLAAYAAEGLSHFIRRFNYSNNLIGTATLINEAIKNNVECFIFTSSIAVYGPGQVPMKEDMVPQPEDPYGIAKYAAELDLKAAYELFGLNNIIFRPHNVYGEFQNIGDKYRNVVGIFMNKILKGESLPIFGDGEQKRAFSYVGDIINIIATAPDIPGAYGKTFNVGADTPFSVNELADKVSKAMGVPDYPRQYLMERKEVRVAFSDHSLVKTFFGERASTSLSAGIQRMADWVKKVGARKTPRFKNIEIHRNLPPSWLE